jgi:YD repeat-containing protein
LINGEGAAAQQITKHEYILEKIIETTANNQTHHLILAKTGLIKNEFTLLQNEKSKQVHFSKVDRNQIKKVNKIAHADLTNEFEYLDANGRTIGQIGKTGQAVKIENNEEHRYQKKIAYANKVTASIADLSEHWVQPSVNDELDRVSYTFFGLNNKIRYEVDAEGYLIEYRYHLNEKAHTIKYKTPVNAEELALLLTGSSINRLPDRDNARISSVFYDEDGHVLAEQDGAGYVIEYKRDKGGRPTCKTSYANPVMTFTDNYTDIKIEKQPDNDASH